MSSIPHKPTDETRNKVISMYSVGVTQEDLSKFLRIDVKTLRKYYRKELDESLVNANAEIGKSLYEKAKSGDTSAIIWWEKTRANKSDKLNIDNRYVDKEGNDLHKSDKELLTKMGFPLE